MATEMCAFGGTSTSDLIDEGTEEKFGGNTASRHRHHRCGSSGWQWYLIYFIVVMEQQLIATHF